MPISAVTRPLLATPGPAAQVPVSEVAQTMYLVSAPLGDLSANMYKVSVPVSVSTHGLIEEHSGSKNGGTSARLV